MLRPYADPASDPFLSTISKDAPPRVSEAAVTGARQGGTVGGLAVSKKTLKV